MAILQSTGIRGFLVSVKKTGNKVVNSIGKTIDEYTENFLSGFAGHGWKLWEYISGKYKLEIDALMVRGTFTVFELLVQKIRSIKGALGITQGNGKIKTVTLSEDGTEYLIDIDGDGVMEKFVSKKSNDDLEKNDWYLETKKKKSIVFEGSEMEWLDFMFADLNGDNIMELIFIGGAHWTSMGIMEYKNNEFQFINDLYIGD